MRRFVTERLKSVLNLLPASVICRVEYGRQTFARFNERPVEFAFVFKQLGRLYPQNVLDVGTGKTALPHLMRNCGCVVTASDNIKDYWPAGMSNRHYHVLNDDITNTQIQDRFDLITCVSVLEHIEAFDDAVRNMFSLLKPGGHLIITCPYNESEYVRNVYDLPGSSYGQDASYITQAFSRRELDSWLQQNNGVIIEQEYWRFWDGRHWTVGSQIIPPRRTNADEAHQLTCLMMQQGAVSDSFA